MVNFLEISDFKVVLEKVFWNFVIFIKGDVFNFEYNDEIYDVVVFDVKFEIDRMGVCMIEIDVFVEFVLFVGYVELERKSGISILRSIKCGFFVGGIVYS